MPYILQNRRDVVDDAVDNVIAALKSLPESEKMRIGDTNYVVTRIILGMFPANSYTEIGNGLRVLTDAEAEIRRRKMASRENEAISENGDIKGF